MLLDKMEKYIQEVNRHNKVWKGITASEITLDDFIEMNEEEREEVWDTLDGRLQKEIILLQEGGLI